MNKQRWWDKKETRLENVEILIENWKDFNDLMNLQLQRTGADQNDKKLFFDNNLIDAIIEEINKNVLPHENISKILYC